MNCKNCGAVVNERDTFCPGCGTKVTVEKPTTVATKEHPIDAFAKYLASFPIFDFCLKACMIFALIFPIYTFLGVFNDLYEFIYDDLYLFRNIFEYLFYVGVIFCFFKRKYLFLSISFGLIVLAEIIDFIKLLDNKYADPEASYYINVLATLAFFGVMFTYALIRTLKDYGVVSNAPKAPVFYAQPTAPVAPAAPAAAPAVKYCAKCGAPNNATDNFCLKCGNPLN